MMKIIFLKLIGGEYILLNPFLKILFNCTCSFTHYSLKVLTFTYIRSTLFDTKTYLNINISAVQTVKSSQPLMHAKNIKSSPPLYASNMLNIKNHSSQVTYYNRSRLFCQFTSNNYFYY